MYNKTIIGLLAAQSVSAVALNDKSGADLSTAGTDWTLKQLNRKVGNLKWTRPHEQEVFDLGSILHDFYGQVGAKFGGEDYGTFEHHGAYYKYGIKPLGSHEPALHDKDYGIGAHGTPENLHNHFEYLEGTPTRSFWNPFPTSSRGEAADGDHYHESVRRAQFEYSVPELRYPEPKPYSYSVTNPSIVYREVEHIAPPKYESPKLRDLAEIETYPEGYTNEYDDYYVDNYFGSDGSDHSHFRYDNIDWIDLNHGHFDPDPNAKVRPVQPAWDQYFVPVVNGPAAEANYSGNLDPKAEAKSLTYYDPEFGVYRYLYDQSLVPGQAYQAQHGSHHDDFIPGAYVENPDGTVQYYEEEVIPTEVIYENPVYGEPVVTAVESDSSSDYPDWLYDLADSLDTVAPTY